MAHKTLVGGTAYEVTGGKCLVGGTAYSIQKGRTLVGGTGYDVSFGPSVIPVTIAGTGHSTYCRVEINGTQYSAATSGIEVLPGSSISFRAAGSTSQPGHIRINGELVAQNSNYALYTWSVPEGIQSINIELNYTSFPMKCSIFVTTT